MQHESKFVVLQTSLGGRLVSRTFFQHTIYVICDQPSLQAWLISQDELSWCPSWHFHRFWASLHWYLMAMLLVRVGWLLYGCQ